MMLFKTILSLYSLHSFLLFSTKRHIYYAKCNCNHLKLFFFFASLHCHCMCVCVCISCKKKKIFQSGIVWRDFLIIIKKEKRKSFMQNVHIVKRCTKPQIRIRYTSIFSDTHTHTHDTNTQKLLKNLLHLIF